MKLHLGLRRRFKVALFRFLRKLADAEEVRELATASLGDLLPRRPPFVDGYADLTPAYPELGGGRSDGPHPRRSDVVFITARYRSGSTLLWNLFRNLPGTTAYFEPLHPRLGLDPGARRQPPDPNHRHVADYWAEYDNIEELQNYHRAEWHDRRLFMDRTSYDPALKRYIELLIARAQGRPVLQCNRIDFRLPWVRHHFPEARIVHLYRHPRDQWCSFLRDPSAFRKDASVAEFVAGGTRHDKFFLIAYVSDLGRHFPFIDWDSVEHPYQIFYYIWKLSYTYSLIFSNVSLSYESIVADPEGRLAELFGLLGIEGYDVGKLKELIDPPPPQRWRGYAEDTWFRRHEETCEAVLSDFLASGSSSRGQCDFHPSAVVACGELASMP